MSRPQGRWSFAAHDYDQDPGKPACAWDDPEARTRLVSTLVNDARAVLDAVRGADLDTTQAEAVGLLGLVAGQDVEPGKQAGTFRVARKVAADRVISMVDPDARHMHKSRSSYRDGDKAHLAVEPETGLVCAAALTPANAADGPTGVGLLATEPPGLEVLGDAAYGGGATRAALRAAGHAADGSSRSPCQRLCEAALPETTSPSWPAGQDGDLPGRPHRGDHAERPGGVRLALWPLPAPRALHPRQGRQDPQPGTRTRPNWRRPAATPLEPGLPGQLPPLATDGGALDRLAGRQAATAGCATAAWPATSSACRCGWPRSTCAGWSPWGWTTTTAGWVLA